MMLLYQHLRLGRLGVRCLFISIFCIRIYALAAQRQVTLSDLPKCAVSCADQAAIEFDCRTTDIPCLCANPIAATTLQCSADTCQPSSQASAEKILIDMCAADISSTTPSPVSSTPPPISSTTAILPSQIPTSLSSTSKSISQTSSASTTSSTTPDLVSSLSQTTTQLASSTVFIITTVIITPTPNTTASLSGSGRLDVSIGTQALFFGLPSLISLLAAI